MSSTSDIELVLRAYLGDDGAAAPDYVLDVVERRIAAQPQRRAWPLAWRPRVTTPIRLAAALAAGVLIAIAGWSVLPKQPTTGEPSPSPLESVGPSSSPTAPPSASTAHPAPVFSPASFVVPFQVSLAGGWNRPVEGFDTPTAVTMARSTLNVTFWSIAETRVRPPGTTVTDYAAMEPWPSDVHAWLETLPYCTVDDPRNTTIGGRPAWVNTYRCQAIPDEPNAEKQGAQTIVFTNPNGPYLQYVSGAVLNRIIEIRTAPNEGIAVIYYASADGPDAAAVDDLLATLVFE